MNLLLVEDDRVVRITVRDALLEAGYQVTACSDFASGIRAAESALFDLVLTDIRLPGASGLELFRRLRQMQPSTAIVLMTAYANTNDAVAAMRSGARDYLIKPFEMDELLFRLDRVSHDLEVQRDFERGATATTSRARHALKGSSPGMARLLEKVEAAAASDVNVVITGETGTGKDLVARTIHERSSRAGKPFVAVNCAAIPENLLESEFFGHEKGAFTGADSKRQGRFGVAHGGTLFLDEVAELPLNHQAKVLRAIDTSSFEPVGSSQSVHVDLRIIAATNSNLLGAISEKVFRKDLYYRLNVMELRILPLRERRADIPQLVAEFLVEISGRAHRTVPALAPETMSALMTHDYPGNVRELIHALEHAVALCRGDIIELDHLPGELRRFAPAAPNTETSSDPTPRPDGIVPLAKVVEEFERQYIHHVLTKAGGHRGRAAALLGISRKGLWEKLRDGG